MNKYRFMAGAMFVLAVWLCGVQSLSAQQASESGIPAHLVVTVEPHHGSDVPVINREEVMVYEGKERDTVTEWIPAQGDHAALELMVLLDDGSNVSLGTQLEDLRKFINEQPTTTMVGVAYMQNGIAKVEQNLTSDHALAAKALRLPLGIRGANGSPYFSLTDLIKRWPASTARREIIMASDGIDLYYGTGDLQDPYLDEAIDVAQRAGILVSAIYTPGVGHLGHSYWQTYWGQLYLARLAEMTGGEAYYIGFSGPPVAFTPYLDDFTRRLSHQYLLTFLAKPPKKAAWQTVKLRTEVPKVDLISAGRVWISPEGK
ncbi:MAG TPA: hypothetical protein VNW97_22630 [Candidatus Saccharimonadales bacterium]|nr:hypothetical protein [Candidatus Saccharimonadales bacterium]